MKAVEPGPKSERKSVIETGLIAAGVGLPGSDLRGLEKFVANLPARAGIAYILVQNVDPPPGTALAAVLERVKYPVIEVGEDTTLKADHIYVAPPNRSLIVQDGILRIAAKPSTNGARPIDRFLATLAGEFCSRTVGIMLSGTASDGVVGLGSIRAEGGITFAQEATTRGESLPHNGAVRAADFVMAPHRIGEELASVVQRWRRVTQELAQTVAGPAWKGVLASLRERTGNDLDLVERDHLAKHVLRRMLIRKTEHLNDYAALLREEAEELEALVEDVAFRPRIFFEDPDYFEAAKATAFPAIVRNRKSPFTLRAWVPGCRSGEEVYSLAIALAEFVDANDLPCAVQIFGTDLSEAAIRQARAGSYDSAALANVSAGRLRRFFIPLQNGYRISPRIRDMCIFSQHRLTEDPPLANMDVISCRRFLSHAPAPVCQRLLAACGYALRPSGCLLLGTDAGQAPGDPFIALDEQHHIYCRGLGLRRVNGTMREPQTDGPLAFRLSATPLDRQQHQREMEARQRLHKYVHEVFLTRYGPAWVLADEALRIVELQGRIGRFLLAPQAASDTRLLEVVRPELRAVLNSALDQARQTGLPVSAHHTFQSGESAPVAAALVIVPISLPEIPPHYMILFRLQNSQARIQHLPPNLVKHSALLRENLHLKKDLQSTRKYLKTVIEELRSSHEEAQSVNEELQSSNEELNASREELQSLNEELNTVNEELQLRNSELMGLTDDLSNLLASTHIPIIMTGNDLRIRHFTPVAQSILHVTQDDIGRPITDLMLHINVPNLEEILRRVVETLQPCEREVQDQDGRSYIMRVRPYQTADRRISGTVLQLLDVTALKRSLDDARHARDYAEAIVDTAREPLVVLDHNLMVRDANRAFYDSLGESERAVSGRILYELAGGRFDVPPVRRLFAQLRGGSSHANAIEMSYQTEAGETRYLSVNARRLHAPGRQPLNLMAFEDITAHKRAGEARYRLLFETARDGILVADASTGEVMDVNPFAEALLGYTRDELVGRKLWEIDPLRHLAQLPADLRDRGVLQLNDHPLRTKAGRELQTEMVATAYAEGERRVVQFNIRDVSERRKFERELRESQKLESLGLLAGGIAHDFNNLLTGMIGNASLAMAEAARDENLRGRLHDIVQIGQRAAFLTRQMLAYAGKGHFSVESLDLSGLVGEISSLLRTSISKSVDLKLDLARNLPPIEADAAQLQQVIMNLVINGAEAIGEGQNGQVEIRTSACTLTAEQAAELFGPEPSLSGPCIQLEVRDTGTGMDEETQARIFDPFFTTKFTGRGLGLAAVQGIVKGHHGAIQVYSSPGQGSTFIILLPATAQPVSAPQHVKVSPAAIPPGALALVIDDEEAIRVLTQNILSRAGMQVLTAENGQIGVEIFEQQHANLSVVLLDLQMPVMGGEEALAHLKRIDPDVPVILSSGYSETEASRRFGGLKPHSFLQKPYTADRLAEIIATAIGKPRVRTA